MCIINRFVSSLAVAAFVVAATSAFVAPASANTYDLDFTDTHGDVADLVLTTSGSFGTVTQITGTLNGLPASELHIFGADQTIFATGPLVDYSGLGFTNGSSSNSPLNLYWTNIDRSGPGELGVCFTASCNNTSGFYALTSIEFTATPLPSTWTMLIAGFVGLGFLAYRGPKKGSAAIAAA
jgi:hypothetical protein